MGKKAKSKDIYETPHVMICTPAYDGKVDTDFSQSLAEAAVALTVFGIRMTASVMGNGAFIDLARCMFAKFFLADKDCTHLFFIDSDLKFEARAVVELVRHNTADKPVTAGAYRRRQDPEDYPLVWTAHPELSKDGIDKLWFDDDGFLMANRVATGFLCIRRNIIEEMVEEAQQLEIKGQGKVPNLFYTYIDDNNRFVGEDFAWCDDYKKKYDQPIAVWPDFDFVHGGYECNYQKWLEQHVGKADNGGIGVLAEEAEEPTRRAV